MNAVLEATANNTEGVDNTTENSPEPQSSTASVSTPASAGSQSAVSTPGSVHSHSAVSTPASVRSQSCDATRVSRPLRAQSVDSTPFSPSFRARFESEPPLETPPPGPHTETLESAPHEASISLSPQAPDSYTTSATEPLEARSTLRQQSSPASYLTTTTTTGALAPENIQEHDITSSTWNVRECALNLKVTVAISSWRFLGRRLGVSESDIEAIDKNHVSDLNEKFYKMMLKWESSRGERATKEELVRALREEKLTQVAEMLEKRVYRYV